MEIREGNEWPRSLTLPSCLLLSSRAEAETWVGQGCGPQFPCPPLTPFLQNQDPLVFQSGVVWVGGEGTDGRDKPGPIPPPNLHPFLHQEAPQV